MYSFATGMFSGDAPFKPEIGGTEYTVSSKTSWVGFFVSHRPIDKAEWFRITAGVGVGNIENDLEDSDGNTYSAIYNENPVAYLGLGFGMEAKKGLLWGVDIGMLQTGGSTVGKTGGNGMDESQTIRDNWMFGSVLPNFQVTLGWDF